MTIVEVGCSTGALLSKLIGPNRTLVCYEPGCGMRCRSNMKKAFFPKAEHKGSWREEPPVANKSHYVFAFKRGGAFHVIRDFFKPSEHMQHYGPIDLFLSSHVLEHVPDLCGWGAALFTTMKAGGGVTSGSTFHT